MRDFIYLTTRFELMYAV